MKINQSKRKLVSLITVSISVIITLSMAKPVLANESEHVPNQTLVISGPTQSQGFATPERGRMATSGVRLTRSYANNVSLFVPSRPGATVGRITTQAQFEVYTRNNLLWFGQRSMSVQRGIDHLPWWNPNVRVAGSHRPIANMGRLAITGEFMSLFEHHLIHHTYFIWGSGWYEFQAH